MISRLMEKTFRLMFIIVFMAGTAWMPAGRAAAQEPEPLKVGLVTDENGIEDMSFNWMAHQGLQQAEADFGIDGTLYESGSSADYAPLLQQCVTDGNQLCFGVGFLMGEAVTAAAIANPGASFAILDYSPQDVPSNLRGIRFDEKQSGYLAGALAGRMTATNLIGVVGGMEIQPVVDFAEGYRNAAQCANPAGNVLIQYTGDFANPALGIETARAMINHGADVIFAAAGATGNGAILYSAQLGVWSIGVDADQYLTIFGGGTVEGSHKLLTSAMKNLDLAVRRTIGDYLNGAFSPGTVTYHLADGGVGLAPYHEADSAIPQVVKDYVDSVEAGILAGSIDINDPCRSLPPQFQPSFSARLAENEVHGYGWHLGTSVTLAIDDPDTGPGADYTKTLVVGTASWDPNQTFVQFRLREGGFQLRPGQFVSMTDGTRIKTHVVTSLAVTTVDAGADTVAGSAAPGSQVDVGHIFCDQDGCFGFRRETADLDGAWVANFSVPGEDGDEQDIVDVKPGMGSEARQCDNDGECTQYGWYVPNPSIGVRAYEDRVEGWQWPLGATVTVTVDDPDTPPAPDISRTATVYEVSWNPGEYRFDLGLSGLIDIRPDFVVTATLGEVTKSHVVTSLQFTNVDIELDVVTGIAAPGSRVDVWTCDNVSCTNRHIHADNLGEWTADFGHFGDEGDEQNTFDIVPGTWIDSSQGDDDGDQTYWGRNVPNPRIEVSYEHDWIQINDFTPDGDVTYTIYDHEGGHALFGPVTGPVDSHGNGWISSNLFRTDLIPGNFITAVNEATGEVKSILIRNLNLDYVGVDEDRMFGTAVPNATIEINISETHDQGFSLNTTVNASGEWEVDLAAAGHPIDEYRHASIRLYDEDGDNIVAQPPRIHAQMSTDNFGVDNFSKNADVTMTLYDHQGGSILYGPVTLRTEGSGNAWVNLWGTGIDLVPGHYIVAHDHLLNFTKSLEVEPFDIQELDAAGDYLSGTAASGEWVSLHVESLFSNWGLDALTDVTGQWLRDYGAENYNITEQMWANGWATDDQDNWSEDHTTGSPGLEASPAEDWISGYNFSPDRKVRVRIYETEGGGLLADVLVNAWGNTQFNLNNWDHGIDLLAGMHILAEDLETGKSAELTLAHLTFDGIDYDAGLGWGRADEGVQVVIRASRLFDNCEITTVADDGENWLVDFSLCGIAIGADWDIRAMVFDQQLDATIANAPRPPEFNASLSEDWVSGSHWSPNNTITIRLYESEGGPAVGSPFVWNTDGYGDFHADLRQEGADLLPGYHITVTDGLSGVVKTLTLPNLTIDYLDPELDVAGGQAPADTRLSLDFSNQLENIQFDMFSESDGTWEADFKLYDFDLQPGTSGSVRIYDEDGDVAQVNGYVPNPTFGVRPEEERVEGWQWPVGEIVLISIDDPGTPEINPDFSAQVTVGLADWNPGESWFNLDFSGQYDLKPGDLVTVTHGTTIKTHTVTSLAVSNINTDTDIISGTTDTAGSVDIWICYEDGCASRKEPVAQNGTWSANFAVPGNENWENEIYDITNGTGGDSAQWDNDGDGTMLGWYVFAHTLHAVPSHPEVHGHDWRWGSDVTLTIDTDTDPTNGYLYTLTKNADDDPWCGYPCFDLSGVFALQVGQYVMMTDGIQTRTVRVSTLQIESVDIDTDTISGIADPGSDVMVNIWSQDGRARHVVADGAGQWMADFSVAGDEDFEQFTADITYGDNGRAIQLNPDGTDDGTLEYWGVDWIPPDWLPLVSALTYSPDLNRPAYNTDTWTLANLLWEPLFRYTDQDGLMPTAATGYAVSADGLVYLITLRNDIHWSDGQEVTARQFVDGFLRILDPATATDYAGLLFDIQGAREYNAGTQTDPGAVGLLALDEHTLQITLAHPASHFPKLLTIPGMMPVRLDLIAQYGDAWTDPGNFVGNGPYLLIEKDNGHVLLQKNPHHHDAAALAFEYIGFDIIADAEGQFAAYQRGEIDVVVDAPQAAIADPDYESDLFASILPGIIQIGLNVEDAPTDNVLVRRALAASIDRRSILDNVLYTPWLQEATGVIPPGLPGYQGTEVGFAFDPQTAQTLLAQAGYPGGEGLPTIHIYGRSWHQPLLEAIAEGWRTILGVSVETHSVDANLTNYLNHCQYTPGCLFNAYRMGWIVDYFDTQSILRDYFHPDYGQQPVGWDSPRYRELIELSMAELDPAQRILYLQEAEQILVETDAVTIPLYFTSRNSLIKPGFDPVFGLIPYFDLWNREQINHPPADVVITAPLDPLAVNSEATLQVDFSDPDENDNHTIRILWGDGATTTIGVTGLTAVADHQYQSAGVYTVDVTVTDPAGASAQAVYQYVVIYDPAGGFVTGGGWIWSPEGAYVSDPSLTGKATFGFVSKYLKGAKVPTGTTEFQFKVAALNFKSTSYDWLVIAGTRAQYKGTGTINGIGEYGFLLTAIDGVPDKFRIKIWDKATGAVIYDNQPGAADTAEPLTIVQGGSIVIHKAK